MALRVEEEWARPGEKRMLQAELACLLAALWPGPGAVRQQLHTSSSYSSLLVPHHTQSCSTFASDTHALILGALVSGLCLTEPPSHTCTHTPCPFLQVLNCPCIGAGMQSTLAAHGATVLGSCGFQPVPLMLGPRALHSAGCAESSAGRKSRSSKSSVALLLLNPLVPSLLCFQAGSLPL